MTVAADPPIKTKPDTVPLMPEHTRGVIGPVSALVFAVGEGQSINGETVCNRNREVFDGKNRLSLTFSHKGSFESEADGNPGTVYRCAVSYTPIAGHRSSSKNVAFIAASRDIEVEMARIGDTRVFGLHGFTIPTRKGTVRASADEFVLK